MKGQQVVVVTGASSGIGRASALALCARGHTVVATARATETLGELVGAGCLLRRLDVTDAAQASELVSSVIGELGRIDVLLNNAGYGLYGPIEQQPIEEVRRLFETNVFSAARLIQLVLPFMRAANSGRIINVSSVGGRVTLPGGGYYHASKFALEALSDALRLEVAPFGVDVVLVEPGPVRTGWTAVALGSLSSVELDSEIDPYADFNAAVATTMVRVDTGRIPWWASRPEHIAHVIVRAVESERPRTRYLVNPAAKSLVALRHLLPDRAYDSLLRRQYGIGSGPARH